MVEVFAILHNAWVLSLGDVDLCDAFFDYIQEEVSGLPPVVVKVTIGYSELDGHINILDNGYFLRN